MIEALKSENERLGVDNERKDSAIEEKDAAIDALKAVNERKDAEIRRLQAMMVPAGRDRCANDYEAARAGGSTHA